MTISDKGSVGSPSSVPIPDPTALTDRAIERAEGAFERKLDGMREVLTEKINGHVAILQTRLNGNDTALTAALAAAGKETAKSEAALIKQIDAIGTLISTATKGLDDKITDLKERVGNFEGRSTGIGNTASFILAAVAALAAAISVIVLLTRPTPMQVSVDKARAAIYWKAYNHDTTWAWSSLDVDNGSGGSIRYNIIPPIAASKTLP